MLLRGIIKGETTLSLSKELKGNHKNLLDWRHILQEFLYENRKILALPDPITESDEVFLNAGEKDFAHTDPSDPPRVRANKKKESGRGAVTDRLYKGFSAELLRKYACHCV